MEIKNERNIGEAEIVLGGKTFIVKELKYGRAKKFNQFMRNNQKILTEINKKFVQVKVDGTDNASTLQILEDVQEEVISQSSTKDVVDFYNLILSTPENPNPITEQFLEDNISPKDTYEFMELIVRMNRFKELGMFSFFPSAILGIVQGQPMNPQTR